MTTERKAKQLKKRYERGVLNVARKIFNTETRRVALVELGKTLVVTEKDGVKTYAFPPDASVSEPSIPRLSWLGAKQYKQQGDSRKGRSQFGPELREAFVENASRTFAVEVAKAMTLTPEGVTPESITPVESPADGLSA
jgi:hypothetical protein